MSKFRMHVRCDGQAFAGDLAAGLSYVLYKLSARFNEHGVERGDVGVVHDENGTPVGDWSVSKR